MPKPKETNVTTVTPVEVDLFEGLVEEASSSSMTVWSAALQAALDKEPSLRFAEGKRPQALEAVYTFATKQTWNPIVKYVIIMGLKTLNRKVGK